MLKVIRDSIAKLRRGSIISGRHIAEVNAMGYVSTKEAAEMTGFPTAYIRQLLLKGKLTGQHWGRDWQVSEASITKYMASNRKRGRASKK